MNKIIFVSRNDEECEAQYIDELQPTRNSQLENLLPWIRSK